MKSANENAEKYHGEQPRARVLDLEVLVLKGPATVDAEEPRPVSLDKISALNHEILDNPFFLFYEIEKSKRGGVSEG